MNATSSVDRIAQRNRLYNTMLGQLYHCLQTGQTYDPIKAYRIPSTPSEHAAA